MRRVPTVAIRRRKASAWSGLMLVSDVQVASSARSAASLAVARRHSMFVTHENLRAGEFGDRRGGVGVEGAGLGGSRLGSLGWS